MSSKLTVATLRANTGRKSVTKLQHTISSPNNITDPNPTVAKIKKEVPDDEIKVNNNYYK